MACTPLTRDRGGGAVGDEPGEMEADRKGDVYGKRADSEKMRVFEMRKSPVFIVFAGAPVAAKNRENLSKRDAGRGHQEVLTIFAFIGLFNIGGFKKLVILAFFVFWWIGCTKRWLTVWGCFGKMSNCGGCEIDICRGVGRC